MVLTIHVLEGAQRVALRRARQANLSRAPGSRTLSTECVKRYEKQITVMLQFNTYEPVEG